MQVRAAMLRDKAFAYSHISEVWMATDVGNWDPGKEGWLQPKDRPDRREAVLSFATDGKRIEWKRWATKRNHLELVVALVEEPMEYGKVTSWMTRLLRK
jgi:hypothetical protein